MFKSVKKKNDYGVFGGYLVVKQDDTRWAVPLDEANSDYQKILEWEKIDGNNIEEAD